MLLRVNCFGCGRQLSLIFMHSKRNKSRIHWTDYENRNFPKYKALEHFDDFYKSVYGAKMWRSLRLGLLCNNKYCAVVNNFSTSEKTMQNLENRGAFNMRKLFQLQYDQQLLDDKPRKEKTEEYVQKMEEKMDFILQETEKRDILSSAFSKYEKANLNQEEEDDDNTKEEESSEQEKYMGKLSLSEGLKDAHIDHRRIIHPKNSISTATLYEFVPATKIKGLDNWICESQHYEYYKKSLDFPINVEDESFLYFPESLNVYVYEKCNVSSFLHPEPGPTGVLDYYLLDGASILPVLALNLRRGDRVLDMCGAPGGKAITAFQTLMPDELLCNDVSLSRVNRIRKVMKEYLFNSSKADQFQISHQNALHIEKENYYNKILVDVPCTNDRVSVNKDDCNYFTSSRQKERIQLPELQCELLSWALKIVAPGGTVVYSTCSLSPIQNDGVVQMALQKVWEESDCEIVVKNMAEAFKPANVVYYLGTNVGMKYGITVLPHLTANFGPLYFCKLEKVA